MHVTRIKRIRHMSRALPRMFRPAELGIRNPVRVLRERVAVTEHVVPPEAPTLEEALAADIGDEVHAVEGEPVLVDSAAFITMVPPIRLPMMQRKRPPPALIDARQIAPHIHLMQRRHRRQPELAVPLYALHDAHIASARRRLFPTGVVILNDDVSKREGEEEARATKGHEAVEDDGPPFLRDAADVLRQAGVVGGEHGDESVHGGEKGVVVYDSDPLNSIIALTIEKLDEREVAVGHIVFLIWGFDEGSFDAEIAHVGLQGGHFPPVWFVLLFRGDDDDEEVGVRVGEPALEIWEGVFETVEECGHAEQYVRGIDGFLLGKGRDF